MPVCVKCGMPFSYAETHVCEGRDKTKLWSLASLAVGALIGGALGFVYGNSVVGQACKKPDASNLCGLTSAPTGPFYIVLGAIMGAAVAVVAVVVILGRRKA